MDLFTVAAKLRLDSGDFEKNLRKMDHEGKGFADSLGKSFDKVKKIAVAIGSAFAVKKVADGLWSVANAAAQAGDKIDKQSQSLGMSRKAYQEWEYILSQSGASIDSMGVSMKTLNSAILEGSDDTRQALSKLHLSTTELKHMSQEDAFKKVVEAFQKIPAGAQKSALAVQLFGRNGQELLPLLNSSAESIDELRRQANELGLVMSDEDVNAAVAFGDALDTLKRTFTSFKYRFGAQILPALTSGMGKITDYAGKLRKAYDARGFAGVFDTVVSDVKNIKWPSWSDVRAAAEAGWETIKKGVAGLGKLVFGENEKGEVKWPTWDDVATAAGEAWETIKKGVADFGGLVFGKTEDGKVNWPDLGTAIDWAKTNLWDNGVVAAVAAFGGLVFGKNEKGEVNLPTIEDMQNAAKDLWGKLKTFVANVFNLGGKLIFGTEKTSGEVKWPSIDDFKQGAKDLWGQLKTFVANAFNLGGKLIFGENTAGEVKWPDVETLKETASELWTKLTDHVKELPALVFGENSVVSSALTNAFSFVQDVGDWILEHADSVAAGVGTIMAAFAIDKLLAVNPLLLGIAAGAALVVTNWNKVKEVIGEVQQAVEDFKKSLEPVNNWFLRLQGGGQGQLVRGQVEDLIADYRKTKVIEKSKGAEAGNKAFENFKNNFAKELREAGASAEEIEQALNNIDMSMSVAQMAEYITSLSTANTEAKSLKDALDSVAGNYEVNINIHTNGTIPNIPFGGGPIPNPKYMKKAIGDWNVPYDNYPTLLHRNEMVLTATQARQYREGSNGFDLQGFAQAVIGAVREGMENASVNAYVNGRKLTKEANRGLFQDMKGRRFAG